MRNIYIFKEDIKYLNLVVIYHNFRHMMNTKIISRYFNIYNIWKFLLFLLLSHRFYLQYCGLLYIDIIEENAQFQLQISKNEDVFTSIKVYRPLIPKFYVWNQVKNSWVSICAAKANTRIHELECYYIILGRR